MKKILFICSANKDRSKTADDYFSKNYSDCLFDSAGTNKKICFQIGSNYIEEQQLEWADRILVMETKHKKIIQDLFGHQYSKKIEVLNIKDIYSYGDQELIEVLVEKVKL